MAEYQIRVRNIQPHERTFDMVATGLKNETLEMIGVDEYGEVKTVEFQGDGSEALVTMTGASDEVAERLNGRIYEHLDR